MASFLNMSRRLLTTSIWGSVTAALSSASWVSSAAMRSLISDTKYLPDMDRPHRAIPSLVATVWASRRHPC